MVSNGWGWGKNGKLLLNRYGVSFRGDENVLELVMMAVEHCKCTKAT